ncbi:OmpA family protein [Streptomyces hainanensis]|uniref:OmpA family protein n=1 Tax=Streptomyces hainanensis TaxID=402648 RepID=A0A4R4TCG0_9ACTN|nr:OmpA family protein [Streptomyces hainanensis]TDC75111.1 OmpA family protein [Streptomyces hainanensis]
MTNRAHHSGRVAMVTLTGAAVLAFGSPALADEGDEPIEQPPGYEAPAAPDIDPEAAGLMLTDGATLADPRVLDVKFVTEDLGTGEDTTETPEEETSGTPEEETSGTPEEDAPDDTGGGQEPAGGQREEQTGGTRKFTLQTDVLFDENSSELSSAAEEALLEVAAAIDEYQPPRVNIFGFTDDQGSYDYGLTLSEERARNTQQVLLGLIGDASGIEFNVRGYSEDYPLYDNATDDGRQRNRRVEISWPTAE